MKKLLNKYTVAYAFALICIGAFLLYCSTVVFQNYNIDTTINKDWNVNVKGVNYYNVDLNNFGFNVVDKYDTIVMHKTLPNIYYSNPAIKVRFTSCAFNVYCNHKLIYTYGSRELDKGSMLGKGIWLISLPSDFQGKDLEIKITVGDSGAFSAFRSMALGSLDQLCFSIIRSNLLCFILTLFMVIIGAITCLVSITLMFIKGLYKKPSYDICMAGALSFFIGIWAMCSMNYIYIFSEQNNLNANIEFLSLYTSYFPFIFLCFDSEKQKNNKKLLYPFLAAYSIFYIAAIILQYTNIAHFTKTLIAFHIFAAATIIIVMINIFNQYNKKSLSDKILKYGYIITSALIVLNLICYNMAKYYFKYNFKSMSFLTVIAIFILILSIMMSNLTYWKEHYISAQDRSMLNKLAYEDILTGLYNRQKVMEELTRLQKTKNTYGLVAFDLNNLKTVNDTYGHQSGDEFITNFANCLKDNDNDEDMITARIGGDEFLVIIKNTTENGVQKYLRLIDNSMNLFNFKRYNKIKLSAAYGYAMSSEVIDNDYEKIMNLADERMYKMKREMKKGKYN